MSIRASACPQCGDPLDIINKQVDQSDFDDLTPSRIEPPNEITYYEDADVTVTASRMVVGDKTYVMTNITSVAMIEQPDASAGCFGCFGVFGGLVALAGLLTLVSSGAFGALVALVGACIVALSVGGYGQTKPNFSVQISSASGEAHAVTSKDKERIAAIVNAVKQAIIERR